MNVVRTEQVKVTLTQAELQQVMREYLNLREDAVVEVVVSTEPEWVDMPVGYSVHCHPPELSHDQEIEVMYRDGSVKKGKAGEWEVCWSQEENHYLDIMKYRIL